MYDQHETNVSQQQLKDVFGQINSSGVCLVGGWAVYYLVNKNFNKRNGRNYMGSRDIDLGFFIDKKWTRADLSKSDFAITIETLTKMGFYSCSCFRMAKEFHWETGKPLSQEETKKLPAYEMVQLCVDFLVDYIHPEIKSIYNFTPLDEPLLSLVYEQGLCRKVEIYDIPVLVPEPHVMLAMKLESVLKRQRDNKRIKDIADIFALMWYSEVELSPLLDNLSNIYSRDKAKSTIDAFDNGDVAQVSTVLQLQESEIKSVFHRMQ